MKRDLLREFDLQMARNRSSGAYEAGTSRSTFLLAQIWSNPERVYRVDKSTVTFMNAMTIVIGLAILFAAIAQVRAWQHGGAHFS
jgi:hypothetical protein